jgi:hypothetical protein
MSSVEVKLPALKRGASETCLDNLLPLNGGGLSLPAIASRSGEAGGVGGEKPTGPTLPFVPSHQGRGIISMPFIPALKGGAFWHIVVKDPL